MIDVHTNGANDLLFNRDQGNAVDAASHAYAAQGATGFVATIMTAPWESMLHAATESAEAAHQLVENLDVTGARCLGIHFEGPFLNPKFRRVHRHDWLLPASIERARALVESCHGALVMVSMAPEVEGVDEAARFFFDQGIVCSGGSHVGKISRRHARDRSRFSHVDACIQRDAATRPPRAVAARRVHARGAHDGAGDLRRLPRGTRDDRRAVPDARRAIGPRERLHGAGRQRLSHRRRRRTRRGRNHRR